MTTEPIETVLNKAGDVTSLLLERREEDGLTLTCSIRARQGTTTHLRFYGVRQLRFRSESTELFGIVILLSHDISSRGWEDIFFHVRDIEEELMSFYCARIEVLP